MTVLVAIWAWIKKWWKWLLLPIGAGLWLFGRLTSKTTVSVVSPELVEHQKAVGVIEAKTRKRLEQARKKRVVDLNEVLQRQQAAAKKIDAAEADQAKTLQDNPETLNRFLKDVGRDARKPRKT